MFLLNLASPNPASCLNLCQPAASPKSLTLDRPSSLKGAINRTATQGMIGTPSYMAPEQFDPNLGTVGPASDIYSLGAIIRGKFRELGLSKFWNASLKCIVRIDSLVLNAEKSLNASPKAVRNLANAEWFVLKKVGRDHPREIATADELSRALGPMSFVLANNACFYSRTN